MLTEESWNGQSLSKAYYEQVVLPLLEARWPGLPHVAGRLGGGSDVLGLDDEMSRDHDWGLRLHLFVRRELVRAVDDHLDRSLPDSFHGLPTRFAFTGHHDRNHHIEVRSVDAFALSRLGFDPRGGATIRDWLSLTGQAVLEVTAGPVFVDREGELARIREALAWYPDDLWRYLVATDWLRIDQEMPLMSRAADRGDDVGSRVIAARLVDITMHLGFLLERRWAPYPKWRGTMFAGLQSVRQVQPSLLRAMSATTWQERQASLAAGLELLHTVQGVVGLETCAPAVIPFWDRPYLHVNEGISRALVDGIDDDRIRRLPAGVGSIEQWCDNVDLLVDATRRRAAGGLS